MRAKRVMSANLPRNKTEGNGYHVDAFDADPDALQHKHRGRSPPLQISPPTDDFTKHTLVTSSGSQ
jgi:hypothetical protein